MFILINHSLDYSAPPPRIVTRHKYHYINLFMYYRMYFYVNIAFTEIFMSYHYTPCFNYFMDLPSLHVETIEIW